ncbi:Crp/Fnr family transcriptional regulator [Sphingomicrobium aestuariivivum]|uniref:Crp/Fnr family transcriptional regulator n=1 Tax=Sphingomicrobium aestuariivivum TaxID=1582356 RepID=UPI001FD686A4|nr:Crp/Fnr family transcriptional regulator [Sphingomicrobium aestuariivivum]MCJ8189763.1 Crp/Fnr family transcriptional regulator [Sphingomicrobium aestuariivivum]
MAMRNGDGIDLLETLTKAGLSQKAAKALAGIPHRMMDVEPRRPFRESGSPRDEVMFVTQGLLCKFKSDGAGRRQIVGLRFPGEGILPGPGSLDYGIQAIVRSKVMIGKESDLEPVLKAHPEITEFFFRLVQRETAINYEWLVNCGRRDSTARVAHLLLETAARAKANPEVDGMPNPFTQQQIADITGQTSVNVNRVFADLERQGLIRREGRRIFFEEPGELRRVASFHADYLQ